MSRPKDKEFFLKFALLLASLFLFLLLALLLRILYLLAFPRPPPAPPQPHLPLQVFPIHPPPPHRGQGDMKKFELVIYDLIPHFFRLTTLVH